MPRRPQRLAKLAAAYSRYSTDDQTSTKEQVALNEELALDHDVTIVRHFADEGLSRDLSDRKDLRALFEFLETNPEVGYIIVNELERLTAGVGQRAEVTRICKNLGIVIITEDEAIDPHDDDAMHKADERAIAARGEVLKIRRRVRRTLRQKARAGVAVLRPPYGTRMKPLVLADGTVLPAGAAMVNGAGKRMSSGELELHPDEYPWLLQIFEWAEAGVALGEIRRRLDAEGVPTKGGKAHWSITAIRGILDNPFYKGEIVWGLRQTLRDAEGKKYREKRDDDDPALVTRESPLGVLIPVERWDKVQLIREANLRRSRARTPQDPRVFDNRVFCARCGYKMYSIDNGRRGESTHWQYVCQTARRPTRKPLPEWGTCTGPHSVSLGHILLALGSSDAIRFPSMSLTVTVRTGGDGGSLARRRARCEAEIEEAQAEMERATRFALKGKISEALLDETERNTDARIAKAQDELASLEEASSSSAEVTGPFTGRYQEMLGEIADALADDSIPIKDRMELLDDVGLDRIYVDKPNLRLHFRD